MIVLYILASIPIVKGIIQYLYYRNKHKTYYKVKGTVIQYHVEGLPTTVSGGYTHYYPIIQFTDKNGANLVLVSSDYNPDRPLYKVGEVIDLLVNPADSNLFLLDIKFDRVVIPIVWVSIGILSWIFLLIYV